MTARPPIKTPRQKVSETTQSRELSQSSSHQIPEYFPESYILEDLNNERSFAEPYILEDLNNERSFAESYILEDLNNVRSDKSQLPSTPKQTARCSDHGKPRSAEKEKFNRNQVIYCVVAVLAVIVALPYLMRTPKSKDCSYWELKQKYPGQDNLFWTTIKVGAENIINGTSDGLAVYLFVHNGSDFTQNLVHDVAQETSTCFDQKLVEIVSDEFTTEEAKEDYGHIITQFKDRVKENSVVFVANLNKIPAEAARSLHAICDTKSPLVKNVIIFLTLIHPAITGNAVKDAEDALVDLWGSIDRSDLDPLITRVTDQVIALKN